MKIKLMKFTDRTCEVSLGQEVVITNVNRRGFHTVGVVSKIGNKIVEVKSKNSNYVLASFYLEGGEKSQHSHNSIYSSVANYEAHIQKQKLTRAFEYVLRYSHHSLREVSEENIQKVIDLLGFRESFEQRLNELN